jgi:hypothetical protein
VTWHSRDNYNSIVSIDEGLVVAQSSGIVTTGFYSCDSATSSGVDQSFDCFGILDGLNNNLILRIVSKDTEIKKKPHEKYILDEYLVKMTKFFILDVSSLGFHF